MTQKIGSHAGVVVVLTILVIFGNINQNFAQAQNFMEVDPDQAKKIVESISQFTPVINENSTQIGIAFDGVENGYLEKPSVNSVISSPSHYTVAKGDTLSLIASKFTVSVATILDANGLTSSQVESIKPGTSLIIPSYNTTDSLAWLDDINKIKAQKAAEEVKTKQIEENNRKKRLALIDKRSVSFRESSSTRQNDSGSFSVLSGSWIKPIHDKGVSRRLVRGHEGVDYRADIGTPVVAAKNGRVISVTGGWSGGFGNSVLIDHGGGLTSRYAHLSRPAVSAGETVSAGDIIAYSGNSGFSTGPHLHFQTEINGRPFDYGL